MDPVNDFFSSPVAAVSRLSEQLRVSCAAASAGRPGVRGSRVQGVRLGLHHSEGRNPCDTADGEAAHSVHRSV